MVMSASGTKPLPLKQRTSSIDQRRDYSTQTWTSLLGMLKLREFVVTVDHFSIWRRHLAWAVPNGKDLRDYMTQRYASSMVFMSLLLSTELQVLFNSAGVTTRMRHSLLTEDYLSVGFWAGFAVILSAILTLLGLISTFTAWTMVSAVSETNAHCIFRSSIGQYAAELPGRFIVGSIYSFLLWLIMFFFLMIPFGVWSLFLLLIVVVLFVHTITAFSAFGRVIMHTGAMGSQPIFDPAYERQLHPHGLHAHLAIKARANLANSTSIMRQYRSKMEPLDRLWSEDELSCRLSDRSQSTTAPTAAVSSTPLPATSLPHPIRKRTASLVKFADGFDTNGDRYEEGTPNRLSIETSGQQTPVSVLSTRSTSSPQPSSRTIPRPPRPARPPEKLPDKAAEEFGEGAASTTSSSDAQPGGMVEKWLSSSNGSLNSDFLEFGGADSISSPRPPVSHVAAIRSVSVVSSLADTEMMTEEERFERDYGGIFDPETASANSFDYSSDGDQQRRRNQDNAGEAQEQTGLLQADHLETEGYSSVRKPP